MIATLKMNDGYSIPQLGMGAYLLPDGDECYNSIRSGLDLGLRLIDTAAAYQNERTVGCAIRESGVDRGEIFLTTKLWVQDYGYENALKSIDGALQRLDIGYIDLLLLHRPAGDNIGAYKALEEVQRQGKVRSIGICNHTKPQLEKLLAATDVVPAINQMECHPLQQQKGLRPFLEEKGILMESWFPLGHGSKRLKFNETLTAIAEKAGKSVSQVILRWHIQEGFIIFPKSTNPDHMKENMEIFDFTLSEEDMNAIRALDAGRYLGGDPESPENFKKWESLTFEL